MGFGPVSKHRPTIRCHRDVYRRGWDRSWTGRGRESIGASRKRIPEHLERMRALIVIIWRCFSCGRGKKLLPWQQRPCPHPMTNDPSRIRSEPPLNPHNSIFQSSIEQELKVGSKIRSKMLRTMLDPSRHGNSAPLGGQCGSLPLKMLSKCCSNAVQMLSEWNCSNGKAKEQEKVVAYQSASSAGGLSPLTLTWSRLHWPLALSYFSF